MTPQPKPTNTRSKSTRREQSQSRSPTIRRPFFASIFHLPRMPSVFNIVRACVYAAVLAWTIICLAIAGHFQSILIPSDLTHFVPFAIFVCSASLLIIIALLGFSLWRDRNPISTRVELGCLGLAGTLWLALGAFVASSDSETADVECFSSAAADAEPIDMPGFNTETYHAQYHVLEAFSFFNMILIWGFFLFLLVLALRQHRMGERRVWITSVTAFPWFNKGQSKQDGKLPLPATSRSRSRSRPSRRATTNEKPYAEKAYVEKAYVEKPQAPQPRRAQTAPEPRPAEPRRIPTRRHSPTRNEAPTYVYWIPHDTPDPAHVKPEPRAARDSKYHRTTTPRR